MSVRLVRQALATDVPSGPRFVLVCIAAHHSYEDEQAGAWPTIDLITHETGISKRSVIRHIQQLEKAGHLIIKRSRNKDGKQAVNQYFIPGATVTPGSSISGDTMAPGPGANSVKSRVPNLQKPGDTMAPNQVSVNNQVEQGSALKKTSKEKKLTVKILQALESLGQPVDEQASLFVTRFARQHPDIPGEWVDQALTEMELRTDIGNQRAYMQSMLRQWSEQGGPPEQRDQSNNSVEDRSDQFYEEYLKRQKERGAK